MKKYVARAWCWFWHGGHEWEYGGSCKNCYEEL